MESQKHMEEKMGSYLQCYCTNKTSLDSDRKFKRIQCLCLQFQIFKNNITCSQLHRILNLEYQQGKKRKQVIIRIYEKIKGKPFQTLILKASAESPWTYSPKYLRRNVKPNQKGKYLLFSIEIVGLMSLNTTEARKFSTAFKSTKLIPEMLEVKNRQT